jgi:hypothetical protein
LGFRKPEDIPDIRSQGHKTAVYPDKSGYNIHKKIHRYMDHDVLYRGNGYKSGFCKSLRHKNSALTTLKKMSGKTNVDIERIGLRLHPLIFQRYDSLRHKFRR